jgi:hypothetical protein
MTGQILFWSLLLIAQNASFTWVSRARNSGSDWYHATAAVFSNGVWFVAFYFTFDLLNMMKLAATAWQTKALIALVYVASTVFGSVFAGRFLRRNVEKGKRRVGHYENTIEPDPPLSATTATSWPLEPQDLDEWDCKDPDCILCNKDAAERYSKRRERERHLLTNMEPMKFVQPDATPEAVL